MNTNKSAIIAIGGAGFIGSRVIQELLKTGVVRVVVFVDLVRGIF